MLKMRYVLMNSEPPGGPPATPPATPPAEPPATPPAEPPATPPATPPVTTLDPPPTPPAGDWPAEWRTLMANGNSQDAERLKRFADPMAMFNSYRAMETKMSDGSLKSDFPEDGTEEEQNAWRTSQGIPEEPEGYYGVLEDGLVVGDEDKPMVDSYFKFAHERNARPSEVNAGVAWYYQMQAEAHEDQIRMDDEARIACNDALNSAWGDNYRGNINMIGGLLDMAPEGVGDFLKGARGPDGVPIFSNPDAVRYFAQLAYEINPAGTIVPEAGMNQLNTVEGRIKEIELVMRTKRDEYNRDEKMQQELRDLYAAREKLQARAG